MTLSDGTGRPTLGDDTNRGVFLRLATDPVIRLWTGRGDIRIEGNALDPAPTIYNGLGVMRDLPEIDRLINGEARRLTLTLSGLSQEIANLIDDDMIGVEGCRAMIGHMRYDRNWRPTGTLRRAWDGLLDDIGLEGKQKGGGHEWSVTVSMSSALVTRNRPALLFWTPKDQNVSHPTDRAFDFVPGYNAGSTRLYPPR